MADKEAIARIKINKLLEEAGWRFFDDANGPANILLENYVKITQNEIDAWGNDYEKTKSGSLDFLLVDSNNKPFCVLEAKKESLHPLVAKEQARKYANTVGAELIILSNGIVHYLWDLKKGNPKPIYTLLVLVSDEDALVIRFSLIFQNWIKYLGAAVPPTVQLA